MTSQYTQIQQLHITAKAIQTPIDLLARTEMMVSPLAASIQTNGDLFWNIDPTDLQRDKAVPVKPKKSLIGDNVIAISGCMDSQTSADAFFGNRYQGALSYCLQNYMYTYPSMPLDKIFKQTAAYIKKFGFEQDPVLTVGNNAEVSKPFII